jgi:hypothetical protein
MQDAPQVTPQGEVQPAPGTSPMKPHRGGAILALGIIGIVVCFITGIIAWVMARATSRRWTPESGTRLATR